MSGGRGIGDSYRRFQEERGNQIRSTQSAIDEAFNRSNRGATYDLHKDNVTALALRKLNESKEDADRTLRFKLARAGLFGGSADADSRAELLENYAEGLNKSRTAGTRASRDLQSDDLREKAALYALAQGGSDSPGLAQMMALQLQANADTRTAEPYLQGIGGLLEGIGTGLEYKYKQGTPRGSERDEDVLRSWFSSSPGASGTTTRIGQ
jgi:hypothetical protein